MLNYPHQLGTAHVSEISCFPFARNPFLFNLQFFFFVVATELGAHCLAMTTNILICCVTPAASS